MRAKHGVSQIANAGWDQRILLFRYGHVVTAFAVCSERYVILIDTLVSPQTATVLLDAVRGELNDGRQLLVINTHADWDHCWGNTVFTGSQTNIAAPIIAHRLCRERLLSEDAQRTLAQKQQDDPRTFADVRMQVPTVVFDGQCTIDGGDLTFELIHTPGHTADHIAVYVPEIATLFPGDAAEFPLPFVDTAATLPQLRASLIKLQALGAQTVLYCHAPGVYDPSAIDANIAYFDTLEHRCQAALASGRVSSNIPAEIDVEMLVGYHLMDVGGADQIDHEELSFYRDAHQQAIRAMLEHLRMST